MNSRDKALRFKRLMPCAFDDEDVEDLIKLLDQHAADQREACQMETLGWMYAQACSYVDEGIDIRKVRVPDIMQAMEEDFLNATGEE